ncbi:enoyl-CoA hydratase-related protein [Sulfitobacter dubius]|uniref:Enoyl-CoA hydratase echA8 n=1 Tax=Sulfitobacter dubius TaxID=218673 RepID=A0ABY3ZRG0_9RHOB|nr:enoyl-CoA hydratase-related protein [Sulfitobacter dubius]UOA17207.1 putative enoyl-CoA hydratase echA8 [Sulfitobacter dubius]
MSAPKVLFETRRDGVGVLTLNDPEHRNPLSDEVMIGVLLDHLRHIESDRDLRALVITGSGSSFSAGGNIHAMHDKEGIFAGSASQITEAYRTTVQQIPLILSRIDIPTIAAVNGPAMGAGCDLALMCDLRLAASTAQFGEVFVRLGLVSGDGGGWFLVRHLGYQRAAEISLRGRPVWAEEALNLGLVLEVVDPEALMERALTMAAEIAAQSPAAIRMTKRLLRMADRTELQDFLAAAGAMQAVAHDSKEHANAVADFVTRKSPSG